MENSSDLVSTTQVPFIIAECLLQTNLFYQNIRKHCTVDSIEITNSMYYSASESDLYHNSVSERESYRLSGVQDHCS